MSDSIVAMSHFLIYCEDEDVSICFVVNNYDQILLYLLVFSRFDECEICRAISNLGIVLNRLGDDSSCSSDMRNRFATSCKSKR